jgi:hypothetical protein
MVVIDIDDATDVSSWQGNLFINVDVELVGKSLVEFVKLSNLGLSFALFKLVSCVSVFIYIYYIFYVIFMKKEF